MKGFIFTLDAVFALVVAVAGISVLLYSGFTPPSFYSATTAQALSALTGMTQTTIARLSPGPIYLNDLEISSNVSTDAWPQFGSNQHLSSSASYSMQTPYLLFTYSTPTAILPSVVLNGGFAAVAAGDKVYVINATNGKLKSVFPNGNPAAVSGDPALYKNMLFYSNVTGGVRGASVYNSVPGWNFSTGSGIISPLEIENNYLVFGTGSGFYILNPLNGTEVAFVNLGAQTEAPLYTNGEYMASTTSLGGQNYLYSYTLSGNSPISIWNAMLTTSLTTAPSAINDTIAVGSGDYLYIFTPDGNEIYRSGDLGSQVLGLAAYSNNYYVQTAKNLYEFSNSGNPVSQVDTPTTSQNSTPIATQAVIYSLAGSSQFQGYSPGLTNMLWNITLPYSYSSGGYSYMALAYGNTYVPDGNTLYVFGMYKPQANDNILHILSSMYLNNQGDYANLLLQSLYNSSTTGIFINSSYAPDLQVASFNSPASSYIEPSGGVQWTGNAIDPFTMSVWIDPTSNNGVIVDELGQMQTNGAWHNSVMEMDSGNVEVRVAGQPFINLGPVPLNRWSNVAMSFNGNSVYKGYINGVPSSNVGGGARSVPAGNPPMYYALGNADSANGGNANYFSGGMLDYQLYNSTLSTQQISQVYQNGAFVQPIYPLSQGLLLWLPLDGNANDYSGAYNNGLQYGNINFVQSNYEPQSLLNAYQISKSSVTQSINVNGTLRSYNISVVLWR